MKTIKVEYSTRNEWLEARRKGVGASEAAAILNLCPFTTPLEVYFSKLGMAPEKKSNLMRFGHLFQAGIAKAYQEDRPDQSLVDMDHRLLKNDNCEVMLATLDYLGTDRVVECKKVTSYQRHKWGDVESEEVPINYYLQVQQQMACADVELADIAALIGDDDFRIYTIKRNEDAINELIRAEVEFMERVKSHDPPLPDFTHPSTASLLDAIEPDTTKTVELNNVFDLDLALAYQELNEQIASERKELESIKSQLLHAMGNASRANLSNGYYLERKTIKRSGYHVKATEYHRFTVKKEKSNG